MGTVIHPKYISMVIFAQLVCQRVWMMYFVEQQHFLGFAISWGSKVSTNGRDDGFNKYPLV